MMEGANLERPGEIGRLSRRDLMKVARQFIAWKRLQKDPSRRERCDRWRVGLIRSGGVNDIFALDHTVPYGTDLCLGHLPGCELPGYNRSVPTGQSRSTTLTFPR
jgi:hypothetical protein